MVAQRKPVSFINRNRKYFLNPDKSTAYHIINSTEKIERMVRLINSDAKTIFDVGANCGIFSAFAARKLPSASIYAFEPSNNLIPFIKMNCSDLNVSIHNIAISERAEIKKIFINIDSQQTNSFNFNSVSIFTSNNRIQEQKINCISLDEFTKNNSISEIDVLKVDVQGFEGEVFRGAKNILPKVKQIFVESTWMDIKSILEIIPFGIKYGFKYATVINPVHMGADILFSRYGIDSTFVFLSFKLEKELLRAAVDLKFLPQFFNLKFY